MGKIVFRLPPDLTDEERHAVGRATLCGGYDVAPFPTERDQVADLLTLAREQPESGYLACPWPHPGATEVLTSATLRERDEPYQFLLELARGRLNQVRTQVADWQQLKFDLLPADLNRLRDLTRRFAREAVAPVADPVALRQILADSGPVADRFAVQFAGQLSELRLKESGPLPTRLGVRLGRLPKASGRSKITSTFTAIRVVPHWDWVEPEESVYRWDDLDALVDWAIGTELAVSVGPVIDFAAGTFPRWLEPWHGDLPSLAAFLCDFCEQLAERYGPRVATWQAFAGFNHQNALGLDEDDRLRLAAKLQDCARLALPRADFVLGLAQPWGDYLAQDEYTYSPLLFADTLIRAGFQFAAVELELFTGGGAGGRASYPRDALGTYRLCELFSILSIPIKLVFAKDLRTQSPGLAPTLALTLALQRVSAITWEAWSADDRPRVAGAELSQDSPEAERLRQQLRDFRTRYLA